jgi:phenylacetic acid degradation operon negative regulatory protein
VNRETTSWRTVEQSLRPWAGSWIGVFLPRKPGIARRDRTGRALAFLGFRALEPGLHVRPDNLAGGVEAARLRLTDLGLDAAALAVGLSALDAPTEARARSLWDVTSLRAGYRRTRLQLERSAERLPRLAPTHAMVESFLLGGQAIRQIVFDPRLPEEMLPGAERRELVARMLDYDKAGRACWAPLMREAGASNLRTPAQLRVVDGDGRLAPPDASFTAG